MERGKEVGESGERKRGKRGERAGGKGKTAEEKVVKKRDSENEYAHHESV